jgi:hypothetical protein
MSQLLLQQQQQQQEVLQTAAAASQHPVLLLEQQQQQQLLGQLRQQEQDPWAQLDKLSAASAKNFSGSNSSSCHAISPTHNQQQQQHLHARHHQKAQLQQQQQQQQLAFLQQQLEHEQQQLRRELQSLYAITTVSPGPAVSTPDCIINVVAGDWPASSSARDAVTVAAAAGSAFPFAASCNVPSSCGSLAQCGAVAVLSGDDVALSSYQVEQLLQLQSQMMQLGV